MASKAQQTAKDVEAFLSIPAHLAEEAIRSASQGAGALITNVGGSAGKVVTDTVKSTVDTATGAVGSVAGTVEDVIQPDSAQQVSSAIFWIIIVAIVGLIVFMVYRAWTGGK